jgi:large subunit ribosomal protein L10
MQTTKRTYSPKKIEMLKKLKEYSKSSSVIAVSKIRKVRARQIMAIRKQFRNELKMIVSKNKLSNMALKGTKEKIDIFLDKITDQNALIFTDMNPFTLQLILEKNKIDLPARAGDIATDDVVLPAGNTGMPPGPVLSEFKEIKVPTKIEAGSIFISKDTSVLKAGEEIDPKLASLLSRLSLKPIKAGLFLEAAFLDGIIFSGEDLRIDTDRYVKDIQKAYNSVLSLGVESLILTKETSPLILGKAYQGAKALILESTYVTKETLPDIISNSQNKALSLLGIAKQKGYT